MIAGKLRNRVEIQTATDASDAQGGRTKTWATVEKAWAAVEPLNSREKFWVSQMQLWATHNVTLRYTPLVNMECRILHGTRVLNIVSVANDEERNRELRLLCVEEV